MACGPLDWSCQVGSVASDYLGTVAGQGIQAMADAISQSVGQTIAALGSIWVAIPNPQLTGGTTTLTPGPPQSAEFSTLLSWVTWISLAICVMSLIVAGARLSLVRRDGDRSLGRIALVLGSAALISGASAAISALLSGLSATGSSPVAFLQGSLHYYVAGMAVFSVVIGAARMAWLQRTEPGRELLASLLTLVVVSGAGVFAIQLAMVAADGLASWILSASTEGKGFAENLTGLIALSGETTGPLGPILVIILGLVALLSTLVQIALMVLRGGMLVLLAGVFPLSASFTNTATGKNWFHKNVAWIIAFILYKPAAAIVYSVAFELIATPVPAGDGGGLLRVVTGVIMMVSALLALPALMRLVTSMVSQAGGGSAATLALAGAGGRLAGELPTGAIRRASAGRGMGGGGAETSSPTGSRSTGAKSSPTIAPTVSKGPPAGGSAAATTGGGAAGGAAAGGGAAAAVPIGVGIVALQQAARLGRNAAGSVKDATEDASGGGPTGS